MKEKRIILMTKIYFINDQHQLNYKKMKLLFPQANKSTEYQVACYITAVPMLFDKTGNEMNHPLTWILDYERKYVIPQYDDESDEEYAERKNIVIEQDYTNSMLDLGRLALHLFNGYEFSLLDCMTRVDQQHYKVIKCAMDIRMGLNKEQ